MRTVRALVLPLLVLTLLGATGWAAGYAVSHWDRVQEASGPLEAPEPTPRDEPESDPEPSDPPTFAPPRAPMEPVFRLDRGDRGKDVRELQYRLHQLAWWPELTTGRYDGATVEAVRGFQRKRDLPATGVADLRTWKRLGRMTEEPTRDQLFNVLHPGPALFAAGATGEGVRDVQARLKQIAWLFGDVTGTFDATTVEAVRGFQAKRAIPVTGEVDRRTLDRLVAMTYTPSYDEMHNIEPAPAEGSPLDPRCRTGRALCVDKSTNSLRWVVDGTVQSSYDVRFGSEELPTREGAFAVNVKSRDHVSSLYDTPMPFAMFFSGGQAVHYSPDFAANGYNGASHGCVNVRDYDGIAALFDQVQVGDKVVVYWS